MIENKNTMELETNPYDNLIEKNHEPVRSPVILGSDAAAENRINNEKNVEIIPLSANADYKKVTVKNNSILYEADIEIEEDMLVPDTFPDMETILNMDGMSTEADIYNETAHCEVKGKISIETMYHSVETYGMKISVVPASVDLSAEITDKIPESAEKLSACVHINRLDYRIINERKYKVKASVHVTVRGQIERDHLFFNSIETEPLHVRKEKMKFISLVSRKTRESEIEDELLINNERIKPVKILKSNFVVSENHRQMTKDKLILNQSIWVRIMYLAEIASKGNLSSQPMLFQGKIDNTQFISLGSGDEEIHACRANSYTEGMCAEINAESTGFKINGIAVSDVELYKIIDKEIVTDFYHDKEEMTYDCKSEIICTGVENLSAECVLRENISLQQASGEGWRIIFMDAHAMDVSYSVEGSTVTIKGKVNLSAVTASEDDNILLAKKVCDFICTREIEHPVQFRIEPECVVVREMSGEITSADSVNLTAHIQVQLNIYNEAELLNISNPCIIRSGEPEKSYPVTVYTVKEGETVWDIGKKFKVSEENITAINKAESIRSGNKIVIVK